MSRKRARCLGYLKEGLECHKLKLLEGVRLGNVVGHDKDLPNDNGSTSMI